MEYPTAPDGKLLIGSWSIDFDKSTNPDLAVVLNKCDIVYSMPNEDSLESLKRRIYAKKAKSFPAFVNYTDSALEWLITEHGKEAFIFVPPEQMFEFTGLDEEVMKNMKGHAEEIKKRLPDGVASAMDNLCEEIGKMHEDRAALIKKYIVACHDQDIGEEQAREEFELYIKSGVPAAELIAPVGICRDLKDGLDGMPDFDPFAEV